MNRYRVYFNRKSEFPQVWSCDEGTQDSEVNLIGFVIHQGCFTESHYSGAKPNEDSPSAWIEVTADYRYIVGGVMHFTRLPADGRA